MYNRTMASTSVALAPKGFEISPPQRKLMGNPTDAELEEFGQAKIAAARAFAQGFRPNQIAKALATKLVPNKRLDREGKERQARLKLNRWLREDQKFRDLIYEIAVVELDLKTPLIFGGLAQSAMKGRVDAAKLALEITGRHTSQAQTVTAVQINLHNVDRPAIDSAQTKG